MTPEERQLLDTVSRQLAEFIDVYNRTHFIDKDIFENPVIFKNDVSFKKGLVVPTDFMEDQTFSLGTATGVKLGLTGEKIGFLGATPVARQAAITAPSGGATIDSAARTAINSIRSVLSTFGFTA